ncbi:MAG TPA: hypothetical protein PLZ12_09800 [Saprospiraceae bacterium]|jgi:hypothetical protein|nr:hypothetical protein [Saprospiraceae bacterium]HRK81731.1 hypothetical protein [Saprospiraceae bacterium]
MMKNILLLSFIGLLATVACSHQGKTPKTENTAAAGASDSYLTMKINGKDWVAEEDITGNLGLMGPGQFGLGGVKIVNGEEQHLSIAIQNVNGPGTYQTIAEQVYNVAQYAVSQQSNGDVKIFKSQKDGQFTIKITKVDGFNTEGTFSGTLPGWLGTTESVVITEGKFRTE